MSEIRLLAEAEPNVLTAVTLITETLWPSAKRLIGEADKVDCDGEAFKIDVAATLDKF